MLDSLSVITIADHDTALHHLRQLQCDPQGIAIMAPKAVFKVIKVEQVPTKAANLLKQTFLAKGGEVAVSRATANLADEYTDVLICATLKQYGAACTRLKQQPWGLAALAKRIELVLKHDCCSAKRDFSWADRSLQIGQAKTVIMGILNVTPDSFSDGGRYNTVTAALQQAQQLALEGADIIDVGAESTRPYGGSMPISELEESSRLLPVLQELVKTLTIPISIDTYKPTVAAAALAAGAHIINDVKGLRVDGMAEVVAAYGAPIVVMHNPDQPEYGSNIMYDILTFLETSIEMGLKAGIAWENFIVDPGIGFGKTTAQNLEVLARLHELKALGCPILLASSRKRFIGETLGGLPVEERLEGTAASVMWGITHGAQLVRVHDVKAIRRVNIMTDLLRSYEHE